MARAMSASPISTSAVYPPPTGTVDAPWPVKSRAYTGPAQAVVIPGGGSLKPWDLRVKASGVIDVSWKIEKGLQGNCTDWYRESGADTLVLKVPERSGRGRYFYGLLSGEGRNFCAGGDIKTFESKGEALPEYLREATAWLQLATAALIQLRAPVITAVQGFAAGGDAVRLPHYNLTTLCHRDNFIGRAVEDIVDKRANRAVSG